MGTLTFEDEDNQGVVHFVQVEIKAMEGLY